MKAPKYSILIAVHNNYALTKLCLESIFRFSVAGTYEVIVIDNASTDATPGYLKTLGDARKIGVLRSEVNLGYLKAQNWALGYARGEYIVPLNNDLTVCSGWLEALHRPFHDNPKMGIVGVWGTCCTLDAMGSGSMGATVDYVELSCSMIPRRLLAEHGYYSEEIQFCYTEDSDLCLRLREIGYDIAHVRLPIHNKGGATTAIVKRHIDMAGYAMRNKLLFCNRWGRYLKTKSFDYSVVIKRTGARGDALLASSVIKALKKKWGRASIYVQTASPDVYQHDPDVKLCSAGIGIPEAPDYFFDLDLAYERKPQQHIIQSYAEVCGVKAEMEIYAYTTDEAREWARQHMPGEKRIVVSMGPSFGKGRNWEPPKWAALILELKRHGWTPFLVGHVHPKIPMAANGTLVGRTTLAQLVAVIETAEAFVGIDALPMHIAQGIANKPTVGLFGRVNPAYRLLPKPWVVAAQVEMHKVACIGCHHLWAPPITHCNDCLRPTEMCMTELQVHDVTRALAKAMAAKEAPTTAAVVEVK